MTKWIACLLVTGACVFAQPPTTPADNGSGTAHADAAGAKAPASGTPKIEFPEVEWKFGAAPQMTTLKHEFKVRNDGDGVLNIKQVVPTCQCTATMPKKNQLGPGEETVIETVLNTQTFQGVITKNITVVSDDPKRPNVILTLSGEILPPYFLRPKEVNLGKMLKSEESKEIEIALTITRGAAVQVKNIKSSSPNLSVVREGPVEEQPDGSKVKKFYAQIKGGNPVGVLRETLTFVTDVAAIPQTPVVVQANVEGEIQIDPKTINIGRVKKGEQASKEFVITKTGAADLQITGAELANPGPFKTEVIADEAGRKYRVRVTLNPDAPEGYHRGTLNVKTNCAGEDTLPVWFYVFVGK